MSVPYTNSHTLILEQYASFFSETPINNERLFHKVIQLLNFCLSNDLSPSYDYSWIIMDLEGQNVNSKEWNNTLPSKIKRSALLNETSIDKSSCKSRKENYWNLCKPY